MSIVSITKEPHDGPGGGASAINQTVQLRNRVVVNASRDDQVQGDSTLDGTACRTAVVNRGPVRERRDPICPSCLPPHRNSKQAVFARGYVLRAGNFFSVPPMPESRTLGPARNSACITSPAPLLRFARDDCTPAARATLLGGHTHILGGKGKVPPYTDVQNRTLWAKRT